MRTHKNNNGDVDGDNKSFSVMVEGADNMWNANSNFVSRAKCGVDTVLSSPVPINKRAEETLSTRQWKRKLYAENRWKVLCLIKIIRTENAASVV